MRKGAASNIRLHLLQRRLARLVRGPGGGAVREVVRQVRCEQFGGYSHIAFSLGHGRLEVAHADVDEPDALRPTGTAASRTASAASWRAPGASRAPAQSTKAGGKDDEDAEPLRVLHRRRGEAELLLHHSEIEKRPVLDQFPVREAVDVNLSEFSASPGRRRAEKVAPVRAACEAAVDDGIAFRDEVLLVRVEVREGSEERSERCPQTLTRRIRPLERAVLNVSLGDELVDCVKIFAVDDLGHETAQGLLVVFPIDRPPSHGRVFACRESPRFHRDAACGERERNSNRGLE